MNYPYHGHICALLVIICSRLVLTASSTVPLKSDKKLDSSIQLKNVQNTDTTRLKRGTSITGPSVRATLEHLLDEFNSGAIHNFKPVEKRGLTHTASWGKRKWSNLTPWGKRRWARYQSWGKRSSDPSIPLIEADLQDGEKRGWDDMGAWGKRGWDDMGSWGKRDVDGLSDEQKRAWKDMGSWGKRFESDKSALESLRTNKRKWADMGSWGKRDSIGNTPKDTNEIKRKWGDMGSWGKRLEDKHTGNADLDKRKWADMGAWGKRAKWSSFASWGKRSPEQA